MAEQAKVSISYFTDDGSIGLTAAGMSASKLKVYAGPFRIILRQIGMLRDFQAGTSAANIQLEIAWEPKLRPMLLALKSDELKIIDDRGETVTSQVEQESMDVVLRPDNPVAEMNLNLNAPDRAAKSLKSLKVKAEVTVPVGIKTFRFPNLAGEDVTVTQDDVSLTLKGTEVEENVWKVNVELSYPGKGAAFESYRQGLFNNQLWLMRADGSRFEHNGGFSESGGVGDRLGFEYLFVDAPGKPSDYQFVYETPSKVVTIPLEFEFKDVPLP